MKPFVLVVDIGNTSTHVGLYHNGRIRSERRLATTETTRANIRRAVAAVCGRRRVRDAVIASVVPSATRIWRAVLAPFRCAWVGHRTPLGIRITYPKPQSIGADRLANACAAAHSYGLPAIVADFGTALTFDVVLPEKGYVGGVIAPGPPFMYRYLAEKTALLPELKPARVRAAVGRSTKQAMQLGGQWGYRGMVREIAGELRRGLGLLRPHLIATGGYAKYAVEGLKPAWKVDPTLTLRGLGHVFELAALKGKKRR